MKRNLTLSNFFFFSIENNFYENQQFIFTFENTMKHITYIIKSQKIFFIKFLLIYLVMEDYFYQNLQHLINCNPEFFFFS